MVKAAKVGMWVKVDGTIIPVLPKKGGKFTLEEIQEMVGGYVERLRLPKNEVLLVDEEGIPKGKPLNRVISEMVGQPIVGDAVVVPRGMGW